MKKPNIKRVGCETCLFRVGETYQDEIDKDITRIFCKARYAEVDVNIMNRYCDHFKMDPKEL